MKNDNYFETGYGRGAGTNDAYTISVNLYVKQNALEKSVMGLQDNSGIAFKKINAGKSVMSGFINLNEIQIAKKIVDYAAEKQIIKCKDKPVSEDTESVFKMGKVNGTDFKGKTPSQLLIAGVPVADLLQQKEYLGKNATGKFEAVNKKMMADIDKAIEKFKKGELTADSVNAINTAIEIFTSGPRYVVQAKPQPYETTGWELRIKCFPNQKNPFNIEWESSTVTVESNVIKSKKNIRTENASMTALEFLSVWKRYVAKLDLLDNIDINKRVAYGDLHKNDWKNVKPADASSINNPEEPPF